MPDWYSGTMSSESVQPRRVWALDIVRGLLILLMVAGHSVAFLYGGGHPWWYGVSALADLVCFTGLLYVSGATAYVAYVHEDHPRWSVVSRLVRRLVMYLFGYYGLGLLVLWVREASLARWWDLVSFDYLPPYTEFIVAFLIFGLLKIPLRPWYRWVARAWWRPLVFGFIAYMLALILPGWIPAGTRFEVLWLGVLGSYAYPVLRYFGVYLMGLYVGRLLYAEESAGEYVRFLFISAAAVGLVVPLAILIQGSSTFDRWPPSPAFIVVGITVVQLIFLVVKLTHNLMKQQWLRRFLILWGQNAFALFFTHTSILYLVVWIGLARAQSSLLFVAYMVLSWLGALYLAYWLPLNYRFDLTLIDWCSCQLGACSHVQEHRIVTRLKRVMLAMVSLPTMLSVRLGGRRVSLVRQRYVWAVLGLMLISAVPLGLAEDTRLMTEAIAGLRGTSNRGWYLTDRDTVVHYEIQIPSSLFAGMDKAPVYLTVDGMVVEALIQDQDTYRTQYDLEALTPGSHMLAATIQTPRGDFVTASSEITVSAPLLVAWTIDWEGYDVSDAYLTAMEQIAVDHDIVMTQLFNPRIYVTEEVTSERATYLTDWVKRRQDVFGDEIGLHLHMFPDFIETTGVTPREEPAWGGGFSFGYDILTSAYPVDEMAQILATSKDVFAEHGLGVPVSYRAGGWFADEETLMALSRELFAIDSSARTAYTFGTHGLTGHWDVSPTQEPYYPSASDQNRPGTFDALDVLEIPNNGADSFAFSGPEMIERFEMNRADYLASPRQVTYLSHPHWFNGRRQAAMREVFEHVDRYGYANDSGPVLYATLEQIAHYWE